MVTGILILSEENFRLLKDRISIVYLLCFFIVLCISCSSVHERKNSRNETITESAAKGKILKLSSVALPHALYSLYVPDNNDSLMPLFVFFDPHAQVMQVAEQYKQMADCCGVILAVSGDVKNGMEPASCYSFYRSLLKDIAQRVVFDTNSCYLAGFSGGARVASYIAFHEPALKGVIMCGAGMDATDMNPSVKYAGIAGLGDLNFAELYQWSLSCDAKTGKSLFLFFEGGHEWPDDSVMESAIRFMKGEGFRPLIQYDKRNWKKLLEVKAELQWLGSSREYEQERKMRLELINSPVMRTAEKQITASIGEEKKTILELEPAFLQNDYLWWKTHTEAYRVIKMIKGMSLDEYLKMRVAGHFSMMGYLYSSNLLQRNNLSDAELFLQKYSWTDPQNADVSFLYGLYLVKTGRYSDAIDSLKSAVDKGFCDLVAWKEKPELQLLKDSVRFLETEARLK